MASASKKLTVTALPYDGKITAFFNELPGLLVQGDSEDDVRNKLGSLLQSYISRLKSIENNFEIIYK